MQWKPEQDERLRQLAAEGLYAREIANSLEAEFLCGINKNKVIGRSHRMRPRCQLAHEPIGGIFMHTPAARAQRARYPGRPKKRKAAAVVAALPFVPPPVEAPRSLDLPLVALEQQHCRFVHGTDKHAYRFCGHQKYNGSSYCAFHEYLTHGGGSR